MIRLAFSKWTSILSVCHLEVALDRLLMMDMEFLMLLLERITSSFMFQVLPDASTQ
jgi:hypothetical protein